MNCASGFDPIRNHLRPFDERIDKHRIARLAGPPGTDLVGHAVAHHVSYLLGHPDQFMHTTPRRINGMQVRPRADIERSRFVVQTATTMT